jgi:Secretion system C-terminal sorting domain
MKKVYVSVLLPVLAAALYMIAVEKQPSRFTGEAGGYADAVGTEQDAAARLQYEYMQLRDPATGKIPVNMRAKELDFLKHLPKDAAATQIAGKSTSTSSLVWAQRGPWNVGGRTRALGIDVSSPNILIAGSCSGGMWRSTDTGASWQPTTPVNDYQSVSCVAQDTRSGHTHVWYYGTGEATGASASATGAYYLGNGIYKSIDSGKTWAVLPATAAGPINFGLWSQVCWGIVVNPADTAHDVVFVAAYGGIYRSADGGTSWTLVLGTFGAGDSYYTDVAVSPTGVVYATLSSDGVDKGIYRSADGITFTNITPDSFPATYNRVKIGISPVDETQVYFLANTPNSGTPDTNFLRQVEWNSLWKYKYDSGTGSGTGGFWRNFSPNLPNSGGLFDKYNCQGSYDIVVKPKPGDSNTVFIGGTNLYRSTSGFADKTHTTFIGGYLQGATLPVVNLYLNHHPDQHELLFFPGNPNKTLSSNDGGVFMTNDNTASTVAWRSLNNGYINTMFYTCAIDHAEANDVIIGGAQDNGSWYTNSATTTAPWITPYGGDGSYCAIADSGKAYYFSLQQGRMRKLKLNASGGTDSFARIDPIGGWGYQFVNPFVLDPNNNNIMYLAAGTNVWRNDNLAGIPYAGNWDTISTNWVRLPDSLPYTGVSVTCLGISTTPANVLYYGTSSRSIFRIDNANVGLPTAVFLYSSQFPTGANVSCLAVDPANSANVIAVFSNYNVPSLFYSSNSGATWTKIGGNLEQNNATGIGNGPSCRWAKIIHVPGGTVYLVGTSIGLFASTRLNDTSTVWTQLGANTIGASIVNMIDYRDVDGLLVVATHSHGIFSTNVTNILDVDKVNDIQLVQSNLNFYNYPNPFSNQTTVSFNLPVKSQVELRLYDLSGKLVSVIAEGEQEAGVNLLPVSGENLSSGVYFCTLQAAGYTETRRFVVSK